jgi:protein-S-isoprenylcysteine O-methyltransferase Ste14
MAEDTTTSAAQVELLRKRGSHTRMFALTVFTLFLFADTLSAHHVALERLMVAAGNLLIVFGGLVRVYAALFIGGWKNQRLAALGPYALTRNPLYVGSLFATLGVGLVTASFTLTAILCGFIMAYYSRTVAREEAYLEQQFGAEYLAYKQAVPRWLPRAGARLRLPGEVTAKPRYVLNGIRDITLVILAYPLCELVRVAHLAHWLPSFYPLW